MAEKMIFNAGQFDVKFMEGPEYEMMPYTPCPIPEEPFPDFQFAEGFEDCVIVMRKHHEIHGVTPEMLDWYWNNMEKGYYLWAPGHHKYFSWEVAPNENGYCGSIEIAYEQTGPGKPVVGPIYIERLDVDGNYPFTTALPHVYIGRGRFNPTEKVYMTMVHMYEPTYYGSRWVTAAYCSKHDAEILAHMIPVFSESPHHDYEMYGFTQFLPKLYDLWKDQPDPSQNVPCDLRVKQKADGRFEYIKKNEATVPWKKRG